MLWHQRLIHCGSYSLKSTSLYINGVPNLSVFNFDDVLKCPTHLKTNFTKRSSNKTLYFFPVKWIKIKRVFWSKPVKKMLKE